MQPLRVAMAFTLLASGCAGPRPPAHEYDGETSYNRRELEPRPGLFTGRDGEWTVYRNDANEPQPQPRTEDVPPPPKRRTLLCAPGYDCDPPAANH